uniref:Uncharacterized protein n=1 Tax=Anguilla anguilla TaxID=7936 RepID=A0A0E9T730_ANGAN
MHCCKSQHNHVFIYKSTVFTKNSF